MKKFDRYPGYIDYYEYHGSTVIGLIRKKGNVMILRDWIIFDSVEEAVTYYNDYCLV